MKGWLVAIGVLAVLVARHRNCPIEEHIGALAMLGGFAALIWLLLWRINRGLW